MMDGVPVISIDAIEKTVTEKGIKAIFVADKELTKDQRDQIRQVAKDIEINDFTGYMSNQTGFLPLTNLLEVMDMPVHVNVNGEERTFTSAEECLSSLLGEYEYEKYCENHAVTNGIVKADTEYIRNLYQELSRGKRI